MCARPQVINVESSHCYPDKFQFFSEVHRVLKPSGRFAYSDLIEARHVEGRKAELLRAGFEIEQTVDLTAGIMRSLAHRSQLVARGVLQYYLPWANVQLAFGLLPFLDIPLTVMHQGYAQVQESCTRGSRVYHALWRGSMVNLCIVLRKT